ncbi:MAG: hypothetical protein A3K66_05330 [Euryarchaeota archaeon RBG_16_67_27]|nr:MAG: hypothetical protein A3K66_05330 [Euryarchaeota archaeon RBG_16_67_27]
MADLRFGCSGWDYEEWIGPFYRNATESKLQAYARVFNTAEINSTFYRPPTPGIVLGWARHSPDNFLFAAKVPQTVTHDRLLDVAQGADKDLRAYADLMRPLLDAGKLGPLLLQLPPRLRFQKTAIHRFLDTLPRDFTFALEPRNKSWIALEAFDLLRDTGVAYTIVDEPLLPPDLHVTAGVAYIRWHGHGQDPWYNYRYSREQLEAWIPRVQQVAREARTVFGFFNNHYHGYAPENCIDVLRMLGVTDAEKARAGKRIEAFRRQGERGEVGVKALTLEDFGAEVTADAALLASLEKFMEPNRFDRARRISAKDVEVHREAGGIRARVKEYRVEVDPGARRIVHDCEDWGKLRDRRELCKHVGRLFLSLPPDEATRLLEDLRANRDAWSFEVPTT